MALAVSVRIDVVDYQGARSFTKIRVPTGFSISQFTEFAQGAAQLVANISGGQVTRASFCVGLDLSSSTIKAIPTSLSDIAQKAFFGFSTAIAGLRTRLKLPAINEAVVNLGSDTINQSDLDVAAFLTAMENGITVTGGTISPVDARENDIVTTDFATELFRKK